MKLNRTELLQALKTVQSGLSRYDIVEQSTAFVFADGQVITYNDEISVTCPIKGLDIEGVIKADILLKLLGKLKRDQLELIIINDNELILTCGRTTAGLPIQREIKLPLKEIGKRDKWHAIPEDFIKHMRFAMNVCSHSLSEPVLNCVHVNVAGHIEASDDIRIVRCTLETIAPLTTFLIPATSVAQVVKFNPTEIANGEAWVHFKNSEQAIMSCRIIQDEFPNIDKHLDVEGADITFPSITNETLERAALFSKHEHLLGEEVEITMANKRMCISAKSNDGWFKEELNVQYDDEPISFNIAPYLLKDILTETLECKICENRLKFQGQDWQYVTCLKDKAE